VIRGARTRDQANQDAEAWRASERRHLTQRRVAHMSSAVEANLRQQMALRRLGGLG
jgi:hypothetical protein